jgi:hypothetical protein
MVQKEMREYTYRRKTDGQLVFSMEKIDNPDYELVAEVELGEFGGGRAVRRTGTGGTEKAETGTA